MRTNTKIIPFALFLSAFIILLSFGGQKADDVVVISNPKTPELKMRFVFKEELSIGEIEGDENYMLGNNIAFNTDQEGNFYVTDWDNHRIQKYDPEGKYLLTIGREGQGPGEFQSLSVARFDNDNNLYIRDSRNSRISFFDKHGKFLKQMLMQEIPDNLYINSKNLFVGMKSSQSQEGNNQKMTYIYGLFDDKLNLVMELYRDEIEAPMPTGRDISSMVEFIAKDFSELAFRPWVVFRMTDDDFIYLGYPDKYEINVYSPEGILVRKITRDYDPIPVSEKDKKSFGESYYSLLPGDLKEKVLAKVEYPKYKPAYKGFALMENGWLIVIVESVAEEYTLFDIFDQDGRYIANFKTTAFKFPIVGIFSESLFFFKNGKVYSVVTENDYKFVKRYSFEIQEYKDNRWVKK
jgi:hypothetical protein